MAPWDLRDYGGTTYRSRQRSTDRGHRVEGPVDCDAAPKPIPIGVAVLLLPLLALALWVLALGGVIWALVVAMSR